MIKKTAVKKTEPSTDMPMSPEVKSKNGRVLVHATKVVMILSVIVFVLATAFASINRSHNRMGGVLSRNARMNTITSEIGVTPGAVPMMNDSAYSTGSSGQAIDMKTIAPESGGDINPAATDARIVKTGNISANVPNIDESMRSLQDIAAQLNGNTLSSSVYQNKNGLKSGSLSIKVPVSQFETAMQRISDTLPNTTNQSTGNQDVTSEYVDLQSRLKNKQVEEAAIAAILEKGSDDIEDILAVTRELSRVRGEIEQIQGQMKYLESQTDMSIINISLTEDTQAKPADGSFRPWQEVKNAVNALIQNLQGLLTFLIRFAIIALPIIIILLLTFGLGGYWIVKKLYHWLNK